jgi:hypothetical protein
MLQRPEKEVSEAAAIWIGLREQVLGKRCREEFLNQILRLFVVVTKAAHEEINGFPVPPNEEI